MVKVFSTDQLIGCWFYLQGAEEPKLKWEHITTLIASLREFVRSTDRKIIATTLSKLKLELDFDSHGISQVQVVLFGFQDAVSIIFCQCFPIKSIKNLSEKNRTKHKSFYIVFLDNLEIIPVHFGCVHIYVRFVILCTSVHSG